MASKPAEQLIEVVQQARQIIEALPDQNIDPKEPVDRNERAIRFYVQSCQNERVRQIYDYNNACIC
jgi:hypothetical protein